MKRYTRSKFRDPGSAPAITKRLLGSSSPANSPPRTPRCSPGGLPVHALCSSSSLSDSMAAARYFSRPFRRMTQRARSSLSCPRNSLALIVGVGRRRRRIWFWSKLPGGVAHRRRVVFFFDFALYGLCFSSSCCRPRAAWYTNSCTRRPMPSSCGTMASLSWPLWSLPLGCGRRWPCSSSSG